MSIRRNPYNLYVMNVALVNLVESYTDKANGGRQKYKYVATRVYDPEQDTVVDESLELLLGAQIPKYNEEKRYALWSELPQLDIKTKQLVGKNKERYCTIASARVYETQPECTIKERRYFPPTEEPPHHEEYEVLSHRNLSTWRVRVLGFTFIDINGDKIYKTAKQVRESDILEHVHSVCTTSKGGMYERVLTMSVVDKRNYCPYLELENTNISIEDEEVAQTKLLKTLVGGWYIMGSDGSLVVDTEELAKQKLETIEVPEGIRIIPEKAFMTPPSNVLPIKRIKLPKTLRVLGASAFEGLAHLESINMPEAIRSIPADVFSRCPKLVRLDLSFVEVLYKCFDTTQHMERLVLPDTLASMDMTHLEIDNLEFRNMSAVKRRILRVMRGRRVWLGCGESRTAVYKVNRIETNGPVVLSNYKVEVQCRDVSALEPNIIGITASSTFKKVDEHGVLQPWQIGAKTEFVCNAENPYRFTPDAYAQGRFSAAVYCSTFPAIEMPKSLVVLQGCIPAKMLEQEYPSVEFAAYTLAASDAVASDSLLWHKMPSLRWILPSRSAMTLQQARVLERKMQPKLAVHCKAVRKACQKAYGIDICEPEAMREFQKRLLCGAVNAECSAFLWDYDMIYVGDYNAVLNKA